MKTFINTADLILASLTEGQLASTLGYTTAGDGGQANYLIETAAAYGGIPDEVIDFTLANGNIAVQQLAFKDLASTTDTTKGFHLVSYPVEAWETAASVKSPEYPYYHLFRYIPRSQHAAIRAKNSVTDLSAYIQSFITDNDLMLVDPGRYKIITAPSISTSLSIVGRNQLDNYDICVFDCSGMTGYMFDLSNKKYLSIDGVSFDGSSGGWNNATKSTTWTGILHNSTPTDPTKFSNNVQVRNLRAGYTDTTGNLIDFANIFVVDCYALDLVYVPYGGLIHCGQNTTTTTTTTFRKCYLHYARQAVQLDANIIDTAFYDTVFESVVVAFSGYVGKGIFYNCYFEDIGYDISGTGISTGLINKNFGNSFGAGILDTAIVSAINIGYGTYEWHGCYFNNLNAAHQALEPTANWCFVMGRGSGNGSGGQVRFVSCIVSSFGANSRWMQDDANQGAYKFEWICESNRYYLPYTDARLLNYGRLPIEFGSTLLPAYREFIEVHNGTFTVHTASYRIPTGSPTGGQWNVGDKIVDTLSTDAQGSVICSVAGTPGTWARLTKMQSMSADIGDASVTVYGVTSASTQWFNTPLTAARTITLNTGAANNAVGDSFHVVRSAAATGAFNLNVGSLKTLTAGQWCDVQFDGSAWQLTAYGSL